MLVVIYLGFVSLGLPDGTLGVAWPTIYPELGLPIGLGGAVLAFGTLLTAAAGFSSGRILARWRTGPVLTVSVLLTATGLGLLAVAQGGVWLFVAAVPLGLGAGAVDAGLSGFVARHYEGKHMNWLHACWGVGATGGPLLFGLVLGTAAGWRGGYAILGGIQLVLVGLFALTLGMWSHAPAKAAAAVHGTEAIWPTRSADSAAGWLSTFIFALYVAVEMTTGLWAGSVLVVQRGFPPDVAAWCAGGYYAAITVGRIGVGFMGWGNRRIVTVGAVLAIAALSGFALATNLPAAAGTLVLAGLGLAPIYPGLMHEVPRRFAPEAVQTVIGRQSGGGALGAAVLPALTGMVASFSLGVVPWLVVGVTVALFGCIRLLDRMT